MTDPLQARYRRDPNVVAREIAGEQILVPIRKQAADMAAIYVLNETGALIWQLMDGQHSVAEVKEALLQGYEVDPGTAETDLLDLVDELLGLGMLRIAEHAV